ncbi:MAG: DinB family protein [Chitinophagaceae bacterium]
MSDLIKLIDFNTWANTLIAERIQQLPQELFTQHTGGSFPSVKATMRHMLEADWRWLHRWKGHAKVSIPDHWQTGDAASITAIWFPVQQEMKPAIINWPSLGFDQVAVITQNDLSLSMSLADSVFHAVNHGSYHRGQLINMLRMLGQEAVQTDYLIYCMQHS